MNNNDNNDDLNNLVSEINTENIIKESEEKSKNRLNSTEAYIGYVIAFVSISYAVITSFLPNLEESCSEFFEYNNEVRQISNSVVPVMEELRSEWLEFAELADTEVYLEYNSADQINEFNKIFINWDTNNDKLYEIRKNFLNIKKYDTDGNHEDILPLVDLGDKYFELDKQYLDKFIEAYEIKNKIIELEKTYYLDWDNASSIEEQDQIASIFFNSRDEYLSQNTSAMKQANNILSSYENELSKFRQMANDICGWTWDN